MTISPKQTGRKKILATKTVIGGKNSHNHNTHSSASESSENLLVFSDSAFVKPSQIVFHVYLTNPL